MALQSAVSLLMNAPPLARPPAVTAAAAAAARNANFVLVSEPDDDEEAEAEAGTVDSDANDVRMAGRAKWADANRALIRREAEEKRMVDAMALTS